MRICHAFYLYKIINHYLPISGKFDTRYARNYYVRLTIILNIK